MMCTWSLLFRVKKILYYIVLILYHGCDSFVDVYKFFHLVHNNKTFAGVPANSTVSEGVPLKLSSLFGLMTYLGLVILCNIAMVRVYCYYIKFHGNCIFKGCKFSKHLCYEECDRNFVSNELWISVSELLFKGGSLFLTYKLGTILTPATQLALHGHFDVSLQCCRESEAIFMFLYQTIRIWCWRRKTLFILQL